MFSKASVTFSGLLIAASMNARPAPGSPQSQQQAPPRTILAGSWTLNRDKSDDPQQKVQEAERSSSGAPNTYPGGGYPGGGNPGGPGGNYPGGGYPGGTGGGYPGGGGGYPGGGYPGGGYPGGGRRGGSPSGSGGPYGGQQGGAQEIETNPKMQPLLHPSGVLDIELKSPEIDLTDDDGHKLTLYTDGRKLQKSKDSNDQEVAAHWAGSQLVSDEKSPLGGRMSRTFEPSRDGRQLFETLRIDNGGSDTPITIRYVYDIAGSDTENNQDADPNRPVLKRNADDRQSH